MRRGRSLPEFPDQAEQQIGGSFGLGMAARNPKHLILFRTPVVFPAKPTEKSMAGI